MSLNARNKGQRGEREAASLLGNWINREFGRNLSQTRDGDADILAIPGLTIEVKRQETLNVSAWWRQVCRASDNRGDIPVLMWRQNRTKWQFGLPAYLLVVGATGMLTLGESDFRVWLLHYLDNTA
jgi:hypothetical protein